MVLLNLHGLLGEGDGGRRMEAGADCSSRGLVVCQIWTFHLCIDCGPCLQLHLRPYNYGEEGNLIEEIMTGLDKE